LSGTRVGSSRSAEAYAKLIETVSLNPAPPARLACYRVLLADFDAAPISAGYPPFAANDRTDDPGAPLPVAEGPIIQTLETFCDQERIAKVDVIKMAAGGAEAMILRGAEPILRRDRPLMILELAPHDLERTGGGLGSYIGYLRRLGYRLYDQRGERRIDDDLAHLAASIPTGGGLPIVACPDSGPK
jgi:FkbM family methyltransferase